MGIRHRLNPGFLPLVQAVAGWLAWHNFRAIPVLDAESERTAGPSIAIVIPARNEADRLPALLESLKRVRYEPFTVTVVDDRSADETPRVAAGHGALVLRGSACPSGWAGKCWACQQGAVSTSSEWILFTDADTVHGPDSLGRAVAAALKEGADIFSLLPRQRCESFWERLLVPYMHALYFVGAWRVNCPGGPTIANGQYLLFRRAAYDDIGGHRAVQGSLIDDVEIATVARKRGKRVVLMRAPGDVQVRMYSGLTSLWEGFSKNAFRFVSISPRSGLPTAVATAAFVGAVPGLVTGASRTRRAVLYIVPAIALLPWVRESGVPVPFVALHPVAAVASQLIALDSMRRSMVKGGTVWKGRRY